MNKVENSNKAKGNYNKNDATQTFSLRQHIVKYNIAGER